MKLQVTPLPDTGILRVSGDLDIYNVDVAQEALRHHIADKPGCALDLGGVETCDTAGLQLLLAARRSAVAAGKTFSIHASNLAIANCGELLGLGAEMGPLRPN